jgi:hypothetical protein
MAKRKSRRGQRGRFNEEEARRIRYRHLIGRPVTVSTDRQTHALVMAYARQEDLNMQAAVTRLLGYGLSVVLAQRKEAEKERRIAEILEPAGNR